MMPTKVGQMSNPHAVLITPNKSHSINLKGLADISTMCGSIVKITITETQTDGGNHHEVALNWSV